MTIPEETIMKHLDWLLTSSEPGAILHNMLVVAAPIDAVGPLGLTAEGQTRVALYGIAPDDDDVDQLIAKAIRAASIDVARNREVALFAALSQEVWALPAHLRKPGYKPGDLSRHPDAVEVTFVYGACSDGRRWRGRRWLTGPKAGQTEDVDLLVGQPTPGEGAGVRVAPLLRKLVGIGK